MLLLLDAPLTNGLLEDLTWSGVAPGAALVILVRPLVGLAVLSLAPMHCRTGDRVLEPRGRLATPFFGVRGVGSLDYLAYAADIADFGRVDEIWATVACTVFFRVLVHGVAAAPSMSWLDRVRRDRL